MRRQEIYTKYNKTYYSLSNIDTKICYVIDVVLPFNITTRQNHSDITYILILMVYYESDKKLSLWLKMKSKVG